MSGSDCPSLRIAVVGGGISGLISVLALLEHKKKENANVEIQIYEQAAKYGEIGAGVGIGPNAQKALQMISAEVDAGFRKVARNPDLSTDLWFNMMVGEADHETSMKQFTTVTGKNAGTGSCHRADFLEEMIKLVDTEVSNFGHLCTGYSTSEDEVTLHFQNKPDRTADVVIASDGVKSRIRRCLYERKGLNLADQMARYSAWVAWRGLIPIEAFRAAMGDECSTKQMLVGSQRHILHFPVRGGKLINLVCFVQDNDHKKLGNHTGPWAEARPKSEMLDDYANFSPQCKKLLEAIEDPSIWGIWTVPELEVTSEPRVVLVGDAAHAMTPHQGAGAGSCCEDALFIAALLCHPSVSGASMKTRSARIQKALDVYGEARHKRGTEIQRTSREAGLMYQFSGPEGSDISKITANIQQRMRWIWEYDVEGELDKALKMLVA